VLILEDVQVRVGVCIPTYSIQRAQSRAAFSVPADMIALAMYLHDVSGGPTLSRPRATFGGRGPAFSGYICTPSTIQPSPNVGGRVGFLSFFPLHTFYKLCAGLCVSVSLIEYVCMKYVCKHQPPVKKPHRQKPKKIIQLPSPPVQTSLVPSHPARS